ncbi:hypothetical protein C4J81_03575 [Deltaproteobacteria bacterium Smac51]|nr:hypothetical protein C4J81_03575 [Deltaproteobacteria bacterium Smac51]
MENIDEIFIASLRTLQKDYDSQAAFARKAGISRQHLNNMLNYGRKGRDSTRRGIAARLGFSNYEEFLNVGRRATGQLASEETKNTLIEETMLVPVREYRRMEKIIENQSKLIERLIETLGKLGLDFRSTDREQLDLFDKKARNTESDSGNE